MTISQDSSESAEVTSQEPAGTEPAARIPRFGAATPIIVTVAIFVVAIVTWWLIGDPQWSFFGARAGASDYAQKSAIVGCLLFWTIFGHIFTGFTFANWPFSKLSQPLAGVVQIIVDILIGIVGTVVLTRGLGSWDPTFSPDAPGGAGYTAAAFIVLVGFYAYAFAATGIGGYPFESVAAPVSSVAQWFFAAFITTVGVIVLVYPNFNVNLAAAAPVPLPTAAGWVYSSIVIVIVAAMQWGNWPWAGIRNKHLRALTAFVVSLGGGYLLMLVLEGLLQLIVPSDIRGGATFALGLEAAELGVCISLWALIVGLIFGPSKIKSVFISRLVRTVVVLVAAVLTYMVFMQFFATSVLHFPATTGNYGGNPLTWMDWVILLVLWYAVAFGGHLGTRRVRSVA
ncbi:MAG: hypothetical protein JWQ19_158 [Subtercola sp.]|nr:hypothetical protein [Subtercola sp.]